MHNSNTATHQKLKRKTVNKKQLLIIFVAGVQTQGACHLRNTFSRSMFVNKDRADCLGMYGLEHYFRVRYRREKKLEGGEKVIVSF